MRIGDRIKNRRIDLGLTVDEIAAALGKNRATVYRYESNAIENFPTTVLEPLADVLETTPAYLMGWTEDPYDYDKDPDNLIGTIPGDICRHLAEIYGGDAEEMWKAYQSMKIPVRNIVVLKKYALSLKKECSFLRERQKRSRKNKEKKFLKTLKTQLISTWRQKA